MTTPHPRSDLLKAIAEGKQIQDTCEDFNTGVRNWLNISTEKALSILSCGGGRFLRIAPETVLINGVECPKPVVKPNAVACVISIVLGGTNINQYAFSTAADAKTVYDALCKPFKSEGV